ncbi:MAG: hypothetical protein OEV72_12995 [Thermoleophilia bacterium]|nr:hypothetical protein [Thermoleophilia bacterium]
MRRSFVASRLSRLAVLVGAVVIGLVGTGTAFAQEERVGYCLKGEFLNLVRGQPSADPQYDGWEYAWYVDGKGITCDAPPAGWVATTTAPDELGVPGNTYAWYRPPAAS